VYIYLIWDTKKNGDPRGRGRGIYPPLTSLIAGWVLLDKDSRGKGTALAPSYNLRPLFA